MKLYSNAFGYAIYTLNYYEDEYFISLFAHFKQKVKSLSVYPNYYKEKFTFFLHCI